MRQAFGVIETVDADHADQRRRIDGLSLFLGHLGKTLHIDGYREAAKRNLSSIDVDIAVEAQFAAHRLAEDVDHVGQIAPGLEADHVVGGKPFRQFHPVRDRLECLQVRERNVQEEAHPVRHAELLELEGQRDQLVVVNPENVIVRDDLGDHLGQPAGHFLIGGRVVFLHIDKIKATVESRPKHGVRVA